MSSQIIKLNVGGKLFVTTRATLESIDGHMLNAMIRHENPAKMIDGAYFIDRNPRTFEWILEHFRGSCVLPRANSLDARKLREEALYFNLTSLLEVLNHQSQPRFTTKDHILVNGTKYTVKDVTTEGYHVTKLNRKYHINAHGSIRPTKIEVGDEVVTYVSNSWKKGIVEETSKAGIKIIVEGEDMPHTSIPAGVRF